MVYAEVLQRLPVEEGEKPEAVRRRLDRELLVSSWAVPLAGESRQEIREKAGVDENAPDWWVSDEEASQSMIAAYGLG